jgi:hydroxypyruvate isomerase
MMTGAGTSFQDGLVRKELHDKFEAAFKQGIDTCAEVGCPNLIAMPGERRGMSLRRNGGQHRGILNRVKGYAEQKNVTLCMEITNSKVAADQRVDQTFNHLDWGWDVCRRVASPRVKVVYDIYHVQIMDGDVVRNLRENLDYICHIHVAGVPSRQEIDGTQELNFRFIANAIAESGYTGYVAHEWRPGPDAIAQEPRGVLRDPERLAMDRGEPSEEPRSRRSSENRHRPRSLVNDDQSETPSHQSARMPHHAARFVKESCEGVTSSWRHCMRVTHGL